MLKKLLKLLSADQEQRNFHNPNVPISDAIAADYVGGGIRSQSGKQVNVSAALGYSPVWQGVDIITSDISRLPLVTYERVNNDFGEGKQRARNHPTYNLLRRSTGSMTVNIWLSRMIGSALLHGNGYSRIWFMQGSRNPARLEFLDADRVTVKRERGQIYYYVKYRREEDADAERTDRLEQSQMFHLQGLTLSDLGGLSIVAFARNTIGRYLSAEQYMDDFHANSSTPAGFFTTPIQMSPEAQANFLKQMQLRHQGGGNHFRTAVLEEGMQWVNIGISPQDAQMIDELKLGVKDVARFFNLPPHKLGDDSRTSFNSTEQENRSYFNTSLGKWISRLEYEANEKLFAPPDKEADRYFAEFKLDPLFKADTASRFAAHAVAIQWGIKSPNEVRAEENLDPYETGNEFLRPLNMSGSGETDPDGGDDAEDVVPQRSEEFIANRIAARDVALERAEFVANRIVNTAVSAAKDPARFLGWINRLEEQHLASICERMQPVFTVTGKDVSAEFADQLIGSARDKLLMASECQPSDLAANVAEMRLAFRQLSREIADKLIMEAGTCFTATTAKSA